MIFIEQRWKIDEKNRIELVSEENLCKFVDSFEVKSPGYETIKFSTSALKTEKIKDVLIKK